MATKIHHLTIYLILENCKFWGVTILNSQYICPGTYTGLMMEQIRNSQEDNRIPASYQVMKIVHSINLHEKNTNLTTP